MWKFFKKKQLFTHPYLEALEVGLKQSEKKFKALNKKSNETLSSIKEHYQYLDMDCVPRDLAPVKAIEKRIKSIKNQIQNKDLLYKDYFEIWSLAGKPDIDYSNSSQSFYFYIPTSSVKTFVAQLEKKFKVVYCYKHCSGPTTKVRVSNHNIEESVLKNHQIGISIITPDPTINLNTVIKLSNDLITVKRLAKENPNQVESKIQSVLKRYNNSYRTPSKEEIALINEIKFYSVIR